jgi:hypothetical protein
MTRKEFLQTGFGGLAGVLATAALIKCGNSGPTGTSNASQTFASTSANNHSHTLTVQKTDVESPPAAGISGITSSASASSGYSSVPHTHTYALTQGQLQSVMGGGSVVITSGITADATGNHSHDFTITKWF